MPPRELTWKQKKFVSEYIKDGNGTQAAIKAGYSKDSASYLAHETLSKPYVQEYMQDKIRESADNCGMTLDWKHKILLQVAESAAKESFDEKGNLVRADARAVVAVIAESNKMAGHYAEDKKADDDKLNMRHVNALVEGLASQLEKEHERDF